MDVQINGLDPESVRNAIKELDVYKSDYDQKMQQVCERLATMGAVRASLTFSRAFYNGVNDVSVVAEPFGNGWRVRASGEAVLFIEYGSGVTYGGGHHDPQGYGPGTYPSTKGNWNNPKGWWYGNRQHTFGNPPSEAMFLAGEDIKREIETVVKEVFGKA